MLRILVSRSSRIGLSHRFEATTLSRKASTNVTSYDILGVSRQATRADIKVAYSRLTAEIADDMRKHPDNLEEHKHRLALVKAAYKTLQSPLARRVYDSILDRAGVTPKSSVAVDQLGEKAQAFQAGPSNTSTASSPFSESIDERRAKALQLQARLKNSTLYKFLHSPWSMTLLNVWFYCGLVGIGYFIYETQLKSREKPKATEEEILKARLQEEAFLVAIGAKKPDQTPGAGTQNT